jgi:hypothetical protein
MKIAFVDESGSPSLADGSQFLTVAALVTDSSRAIELCVKRARRALRLHSPLGELKAAHSRPIVIKRLLNALAQESCGIYALIVDKRGIGEHQAEQVYRAAVGQLVLHCVTDWPDLRIYLDKRYTHRRQQIELEFAIRQAIAGAPGHIVLVEQLDSQGCPGLQAVDFVAWAIAQKYTQGENWAASLIACNIVKEELVMAKKLAALPGGR